MDVTKLGTRKRAQRLDTGAAPRALGPRTRYHVIACGPGPSPGLGPEAVLFVSHACSTGDNQRSRILVCSSFDLEDRTRYSLDYIELIGTSKQPDLIRAIYVHIPAVLCYTLVPIVQTMMKARHDDFLQGSRFDQSYALSLRI